MRGGSADRPDSDADDSDGPEDEDNDGEEEDEEDSQAESGLSATPSVSASPQHFSGAAQLDVAPSSLLAQMSISSSQQTSTPPPLPPPPPPSQTPQAQTFTPAQPPAQNLPQTPFVDPTDPSDLDSVAMLSPVSPTKQMTISAMILSPTTTASFTHYPLATPTTFTTATATTTSVAPSSSSSDPHSSDTESVHMMSPMSPCRQMSIDYPDFDVPPSPPAPGKGFAKLGQVRPSESSRSVFVCPSHPPVPLLHVCQCLCPYPYPCSCPYPCFESCMPGASAKLL